jgi:hypothetical protein
MVFSVCSEQMDELRLQVTKTQFQLLYNCLLSSHIHLNIGVPDPDPYVFGPPGSGSVIICTDPDLDPSIKKQTN